MVEVEYFIALCDYTLPQLPRLEKGLQESLRNIYRNFTAADAQTVKDIEKTTNHDVKAVEYFLKRRFDEMQLGGVKEFIHFGLTSQDINNTAIPLSFKGAIQSIYLPKLDQIMILLNHKAEEWKDIAMLARTHGQPASPTRLGKEIMVFSERLQKQADILRKLPFAAKFGGATGNFNAHHVAYPDRDWKKFGNHFVNDILGLERSQYTTQIEHYDNLATWCDTLKHINTILIDFSRDIWNYISIEYFKQRIKKDEVGSSAMPHKVNPIDFENAEGNFGVANALFEHLADKLPISRMQRDLTDSTVLRNLGVPVAHTLISFESLLKGMDKMIINEAAFEKDLKRNWIVVSEGIQTVLRREGYPAPYEALKALTRNNRPIDQETMNAFIDALEVSDQIKAELKRITPFNYTGI
jgi:adenylosuccinate lyase